MAPTDSSPIPIINFARLSTDFSSVAHEIQSTASTWGFLYITNHGVPQPAIDRMRAISTTFFTATDPAQKTLCPWDSLTNAGYDNKTGTQEAYFREHGAHDRTATADPKEGFVVRKRASYDQPLPPYLRAVDDEIQAFMREAHEKIALRVLECLSAAMGLPRGALPALHDFDRPSFSTLRLLHYPALAADADADAPVRLAAHTDHTSITLLFQHDVAGLQIRQPTLHGPVAPGERWLDAPVVPGAVLVNIGETLSFLSGGLLRSTLHRVARSPREEERGRGRFSTVYFCHADEETALEMLPGVEALGGVRRSPPVSCVTGRRVGTVKEWIQHRHSRGRLSAGKEAGVVVQEAY